MPNVKISAATDAGTLLSSDMLPLARSGDTNAYHATMTEISAFASLSVSSGAYGNIGRNLLHNALFEVVQRGTGPFTAPGYTLDRWAVSNSNGTVSVTAVAMADADRAAVGDESAILAYQNAFTGTAGTADYVMVAYQPIESVRRLSGKTFTLSFWARTTSGTPKLGLNFMQSFGTGGSPSPPVYGTAQAVTLSTTWTRYTSAPFSVPSASGKTLGTTPGTDYTQLTFWGSSGATNNANAGGIGVQSATVLLWGAQLEIGTVATQLEKLDLRYDTANCMRFYQSGAIQFYSYGAAGMNFAISNSLPGTMRAQPVVNNTVTVNNNCTVTGISNLSTTSQINMAGTVTTAGPFEAQAVYTASADF